MLTKNHVLELRVKRLPPDLDVHFRRHQHLRDKQEHDLDEQSRRGLVLRRFPVRSPKKTLSVLRRHTPLLAAFHEARAVAACRHGWSGSCCGTAGRQSFESGRQLRTAA